MKQETSGLAKNIYKVEKKTEQLQQKIENIEEKQKELDHIWIRWEMERVAFMFRIQNVPEERHENLRLMLGELLAPLAGVDSETMQKELDLVYRVSSRYSKKNNLPRDTCQI